MRLLLKNCLCVTLNPPGAELGDLRIGEGKILSRGKRLNLGAGEKVIDCGGKVVMPGNVCAHTHLYSALVRGLPPPVRRPADFLQILSMLWWKIDRVLDDESIYYSALAGAVEAAQSGTTLLVDHHASPNAIHGSLDIIKQALLEVGLRGVLSYEVTDRGGKKRRDQGLAENDRFLALHDRHPMIRALVGAHASFTLSTPSLEACGDLAAAHGTGVHIHVAEDAIDVRDARNRHTSGIVKRLDAAGIVTRHSVFAHCVHLEPAEFRALNSAGVWLVHNPRSNMNNRVGHSPLGRFGTRSALGTDGFAADMFEEARAGFFRAREADAGANTMPRLFAGGWGMASEIFGQPFGGLDPGCVADLAVLDYVPATPCTPSTVSGHVLFGFRSAAVESVMVDGKWIVRDHQILGVDVAMVMHKARIAAKRIWDAIA